MEVSATSPEAVPTVPAALAYECINSVPFNQSAAVDLLDSIRPYLEWQTNLQWIKDPPVEYAQKIQAPYDFLKNFEGIYTKASAGSYASEYEFGFELYRCFQRAHNGHFVLVPDSVGNIFWFGRPTPLVSVSMDGTSIPEVFVYTDILETIKGNASFVPSPITLIDGQNSTEYLLNWSQYGVLQDPDALWNNVFYLLGAVSLGAAGGGTGTFAGGGRGRFLYPGASTTLTFSNGSAVTHPNFARVLVPFDNITSGADIYKQYLTPPGKIMPAEEFATQITTFPVTTTTLSHPSATLTTTSTTVLAPGFPKPFIGEANNTNSGYFLEGEGYDDVAVLSIQNFVGQGSDEIPFQAVNTYFIDQAVARNKTKLIIDVSANGGGTILQGYDLFKQLFPHLLPYGANRFRAHEALHYIGQEYSAFSGQFERSMGLHGDGKVVSSFYNYRSNVNVNYTKFKSWSEKFGPETFGPGPDNYTSLERWNLTDVLTPVSSGGIYVSGYLKRSNITTQPFASENVVIVTDGYCASTCAIFSELMRQQAGVKMIFLGGRPNTDIAQAVGGVKGTSMRSYGTIFESVQVSFAYEFVHSRDFYNRTALGAYNNLAGHRTRASVNSGEGFRQNDTSNIPLHFQYEPADCRIYYTPEMAVDMTAAWKTVADSAFNAVNHCIAGGFSSGEEGSSARRSVDMSRRKKRGVRKDLDVEVHKKAIMNFWTGKDGISFEGSGDAYMLP